MHLNEHKSSLFSVLFCVAIFGTPLNGLTFPINQQPAQPAAVAFSFASSESQDADNPATDGSSQEQPAPTSTPQPEIEEVIYKLQFPPFEGQDVLMLQERLIELGYREVGIADGAFIEQTDAAVRHFQYVNDLEPNGIVDQQTYSLLFSNQAVSFDPMPPFPGYNLSFNTSVPIRDQQNLQNRLVELGYMDTSLDEWRKNIYGAETRRAVINFQEINLLDPTGIVDIYTWNRLFSPQALPANESDLSCYTQKADWENNIFPLSGEPLVILRNEEQLWVALSTGTDYYENMVQEIDLTPSGPLLTKTPILVGAYAKVDNRIGSMVYAGKQLWLLFPNEGDPKNGPQLQSLNPMTAELGELIDFADCGSKKCASSSALGFDGTHLWASAGESIWAVNPYSGKATGASFDMGQQIYGNMVSDGTCLWMQAENDLAAVNTFSYSGRCNDAVLVTDSLPSGDFLLSDRAIWVSDGKKQVVFYDFRSKQMGNPIQVGSGVNALAFDGQRLWVANQNDDSILGFDDRGVSGRPVAVCDQPSALYYDDYHLWVASAGNHTLQYLDISEYYIPLIVSTPTPTPAVTTNTQQATFNRELYLIYPKMTGEDVLKCQQRLVSLGYEEITSPSNVFDPMMEQAVRRFQEHNGLPVDGVIGEQTWELLFSPTAKSPSL